MAAISDVMLEAGDIARCKIDSGCDRHMFNDMAWFPDGIDKPRTEMKVRVADGLTLNVIGIGTARAKADAGFGGNDPVMMQWSGALLVEGLAEARHGPAHVAEMDVVDVLAQPADRLDQIDAHDGAAYIEVMIPNDESQPLPGSTIDSGYKLRTPQPG